MARSKLIHSTAGTATATARFAWWHHAASARGHKREERRVSADPTDILLT